MPVEIHQLVIKAKVVDASIQENNESSAGNSNGDNNSKEKERTQQQKINTQFIDILNRSKER